MNNSELHRNLDHATIRYIRCNHSEDALRLDGQPV